MQRNVYPQPHWRALKLSSLFNRSCWWSSALLSGKHGRYRDAAAGADGNEPHPFSNVRPPHGTCTAVPVVQETAKKMHASMGRIWGPVRMKDTEKYMAVGSYTAAQRLVPRLRARVGVYCHVRWTRSSST